LYLKLYTVDLVIVSDIKNKAFPIFPKKWLHSGETCVFQVFNIKFDN